ncbi:MAG: hypothetical protein AABX79_02010 [Nanoarchaeota archaeon]
MRNKKVNNAFFPRNRRGQEGMSTATIIGLIIGLVILVVVILGFTMGWDRVFPFFFSTNNVESIKTNCAAACATNNQYSYCTSPRTLKAEDLPADADDKAQKSVTKTCYFFATTTTPDDYSKYGIDECPSIECPQPQ